MNKQEYTKKIIDLLDNGPFDDQEIKKWKERILQMSEQEMGDLFKLLKQKEEILAQADDFFIEVANDVEKDLEITPKEIPFESLSSDSLVEILKTRLVWLLQNEKIDVLKKLDQYFVNSKFLKKNIVEEADLFIDAIANNKEILLPFNKEVNKITIGEWIYFYNSFKGIDNRENIDRVNFLSNNEKARLIAKEEKDIILKLLRVYDFLLNPANFKISLEREEIMKPRSVIGVPKTQEEQEIDNLEKMAANYELGSLERRAIEEEIRKLKLNIRYQNMKK